MAIYSCGISNSRKNGVKTVSAKEHHEYISRIGNYSPIIEEKTIQSATSHLEYIQRQENYQHREEYEDLVCSENKNMPSWAEENPNVFWIASEEFERSNGRTYSEFLLSLPCELSDEENKELVKVFCEEMFGESFVHSYGIHSKPSNTEGIQNIHAHIMFSERKLDEFERAAEKFFKRYNPKNPQRGGAKKDRFWNDKSMFRYARKSWETLLNRELENKGIEKVSASSLNIQRMEAKLAGDVLKEEFFNRPPINCPGKILMKLKKYGIDTLSKKEKEQYESYLLAKELRDMGKEIYALSRELEKEEGKSSSSFVMETKKEESRSDESKVRREKMKDFTEKFATVIEDRVRYAVLTEKQEAAENRKVNSYEQEKWRSQFLAGGLATLLLEDSENIYQRQLKEILLERGKSSKVTSTIEEVTSFPEDYSSLKHEDFEFLPSPELYQARRIRVEKECKELFLEKEKRLQEHQEWHFKNYLYMYGFIIESALEELPSLEDSKKEALLSYRKGIQNIEKKLDTISYKKNSGKIARFFHKLEEKGVEKEMKEWNKQFSNTIKEYAKDPDFYKVYTKVLLQHIDIRQGIRKDKEKDEIGQKFVEDIQSINVKLEMKQFEIEYLSYLESHGMLDEKVIKTGIEEKVENKMASLEQEQEKIFQRKESIRQQERAEKERKEMEEKAALEAKAKAEAEKREKIIKMWNPIQKDTPNVSLAKDKDQFNHTLLNKYLEVAFRYGESQYRLESAEKALQHPEKFENKPQVLEKYKKLREEHRTDSLASWKDLESMKSAVNNELCYYLSRDLISIYEKKYGELLKEQRRVSSLLDHKKEKGENVTQEFAILKGIQNERFYLRLVFMKIINVEEIHDTFGPRYSRKETSLLDVSEVQKTRVEGEKETIQANVEKKLSKGVQKGKEESSPAPRTRQRDKDEDMKIAKKAQKQEKDLKIKGNYIAPIIPKKKKKKWKDLVNDDDRDF